MSAEVTFPVMSTEDGAVGVVVTWFVDDGAQVKADQLVAEIAMDKVDAEVVAPSAGTIRITAEEGAEVSQGSVIATIEA